MATVQTPATAAVNFVRVVIQNKETGQGIPSLLVVLFDLDVWPDPEARANPPIDRVPPADGVRDLATLYARGNRAGSGLTDDRGEVYFEIARRDFNLAADREDRPDLVLLVLAPEEPGVTLENRLLLLSHDVRLNAGTREAYIVRLPSDLLRKRGISTEPRREDSGDTARSRVARYVSQRELEREFNTGVAEYHGTQLAREKEEKALLRREIVGKIVADRAKSRPKGILVEQGDDIGEKNMEVVGGGVAEANAMLDTTGDHGVPVNLYLTPADRERLAQHFDGATGEYVDIPQAEIDPILFRTNSSENPGTLLVHNNPILKQAEEEGRDAEEAKVLTGIADEEPTPGVVVTGSNVETVEDQDMPRYIARLVDGMTSPDSVLRPDPTKPQPDQRGVAKSVNEFQLDRGPSEVPAFYDFHVLQIAFDHVWKQLFDESIPDLAYTAENLGKNKLGLGSIIHDLVSSGPLGKWGVTIAPHEVPPVIARFFDLTRQEYNDLTPSMREQLLFLATAIANLPGRNVHELRQIQAHREQGDRIIEAVRHDDYHTLHKTLTDLQQRLTGKYEFTVFAADKDYHSVNFGLLNTYRQLWTPLNYQVGKLVKTIPLAPKEERKYSLRVTRNEKRSSKEARKNNSSLTSEQSSTSRVESDIMAKAMQKTNFSLSAEGDYDIYISKGKSTTTFGVEAQNESAQNRKDFREAVLKAIQEYKEETSTEVVTEETIGTESTESGMINNPNDERSVTYLFYDLQRRYRLSERLYRVMPVVLVAQEVPSPDKITEAWVLAHDWIINRSLLDDSFRPALQYLANKSVGDDFALRELRKNLRQQRNLVETLRIEFSAASVEAENRYTALEGAISKRIDEEHGEATDGLISDIGDFFGGGGQDPEAAKARELAAKDAHQYAVERAEKVAVALRQEVTTLHRLTTEYNQTLQAHLDNETRVKRLLVHISANIFHYMQAIWSMEPPDQRFLRLHKVRVPVLESAGRRYRVKVAAEPDIFAEFREPGTEKHKAFLQGSLKQPPPGERFSTKTLVEVADLDSLLGFKGNYMIFPLKEHNALTEFMAAPYVDAAFGAMDPDELANVSLDEYATYVRRLHEKLDEQAFEAMRPQLKAWLEKLLADPLRHGDEVVVPANSLFIEALVGGFSLLEPFKERHRILDVLKAQAEVRKAELENVRLASRLLNQEREDPDVDKKIVVEGNGIHPVVDPG